MQGPFGAIANTSEIYVTSFDPLIYCRQMTRIIKKKIDHFWLVLNQPASHLFYATLASDRHGIISLLYSFF